MKQKTCALISAVLSVFLLCAASDAISGAHESMAKLLVPNLPTGG